MTEQATIPQKQYAVQLTGPDELVFTKDKPVEGPGPYGIHARVEAVGLCFSDLKLLKQFSGHARKGAVVDGIDSEVLDGLPGYVPGDAATVPGHEAVVRIIAVGEKVTGVAPGDRFLVQTDYRWLGTGPSNAAFGYNFEGALQEYVVMDQRVITSPEGESMLIPVSESLSASSVALVEPWACVEDAYAVKERQRIRDGGRMLIVADSALGHTHIRGLLDQYGRPAEIVWVSQFPWPNNLETPLTQGHSITDLDDGEFDDVIYFGDNVETVEAIFPKIAAHGLLSIVQCNGAFERDVVVPVGRVHYGGIRVIGTGCEDPSAAMKRIPASGEIRPNEAVHVIGAGGPMGVMHVVRNLCLGVQGVSVVGSDLDDARVEHLQRLAEPLAQREGLTFQAVNPKKDEPTGPFSYIVLMAPVGPLVTQSVEQVDEGGILNIFAGIPVTVSAPLDLNAYIRKGLYMIGTSGSLIEDMKRVLGRLTEGRLDTNISVSAVCGLDGAVEGIRAVENQAIAGKIIVYPGCHGLGLVPLEKLGETVSGIEKAMPQGVWTLEAEKQLLQAFGQS